MANGRAELKGGEDIEKREMRNRKLRSKFVLEGIAQNEVAAEMGINVRVFNNKLGRRMVNGYEIRFTEGQKEWLSKRFDIPVEDIE